MTGYVLHLSQTAKHLLRTHISGYIMQSTVDACVPQGRLSFLEMFRVMMRGQERFVGLVYLLFDTEVFRLRHAPDVIRNSVHSYVIVRRV